MELDVFQIMPNHVHGIIMLNEANLNETKVGAPLAGALNNLIAQMIWNNLQGPTGQGQALPLRNPNRSVILLVHTNRW
jgi:hypothetical protein